MEAHHAGGWAGARVPAAETAPSAAPTENSSLKFVVVLLLAAGDRRQPPLTSTGALSGSRS